MSSPHVVVLGGGISGLAAAYYLARNSVRVTLVEKSGRLGGWIKSFPLANSRVSLEAGPRTFRSPPEPAVLQLIHDLNLTSSMIRMRASSPGTILRYILLNDGLATVPPPSPVLAPLFPKFWFALWALAREPFKLPNRQGDIDDEDLDTFIARRFSPEVARVLASSMVHGIYAADSRKLSVRAAFPFLYHAEREGKGSILSGLSRSREMRRDAVKQKQGLFLKGADETLRALSNVTSFSFLGGMELIIRTLEAALKNMGVELHTRKEVVGLERAPGARYRVTISGADSMAIDASHVLSTLPLPALHKIVGRTPQYAKSPLPNLLSNPSSSVQVLNLVFPPSERRLHPRGFGYLVPRPITGYPHDATTTNASGQRIVQNVLGTVFDSELDVDHCPSEQPTIMTMMLGGPFPLYGSSRAQESKDSCTESTILEPPILQIFLHTLETHLGRPLPEPTLHAFHTHHNAIPTYGPGSTSNFRLLQATLQNEVWGGRLYVVGTGLSGPGIGDAITGVRFAVKNILESIHRVE